ncbi:MAG: phenylalanine--tRNA ligase subunit beta [Proteobacteria bacterium]|nr:phenylalanine--tRNA ligase subunit beta [Pseudomonadota bacterium]
MKLSLDWINDYVDISDIDPNDIAHKLTMTTAEVEEVITIKRKIDQVVVGEIKTINLVEEARGLKEVIIDYGEANTRTLTTAKNLAVGGKYAFAQLGSVLNGQQYVEIREIAGAESHGKLCTPNDLSLGEFDDQLLQIPDSVPIGAKLTDLISKTDYLLHIDNHSLTHRPDLWGHYGFAREVSAVLKRPLKPLKLWDHKIASDMPAIDIKNEDHSNCPVYNCIRISNYRHTPSPLTVQARLDALGHRAYSLAVDLTNYVMLETAQPLHAFDGSSIRGIQIAESGKSQKIMTLDDVERDIEPNDLIISNEQGQPIALAGIMGGRSSQVTAETRSLLLESACFKGPIVRKTANRLQLSTEAGKRFEKRLPPAMARLALKRMLYLLVHEQPEIDVESGLTSSGALSNNKREIVIPISYFSKRIGVQVSKKEIKRHLKALEFVVTEKRNNLRIEVPAFRSQEDISIPEDILEEVARMYGYDKVQPVLPETSMKAVSRDKPLELEKVVRRFLTRSARFQEVQTYNWYDHNIPGSLPRDSNELVNLVNPVSNKNPYLRDMILPNLLKIMMKNADYCQDNSIFEIGSVFYQDREVRVVSAVNYSLQRRIDLESFYLSLKGHLDGLFDEIGLQYPEYVPYAELNLEESGNYPALAICAEGNKLGRIGILKQDICSTIIQDCQVVWFELELDAIISLKQETKRYKPIPKYPGSWFDFSILFPKSTAFREIESSLDKYLNPLLKNRRYLYKYTGEGIQSEMTSYTYRFEVGSDDKTLSNEELESVHNSLIDFFKQEGIEVR